MTGMAYVDVVFASAPISTPREPRSRPASSGARPALPPNVRVQVGPAASTTGWVFEYALTDPARVSSLLDLRRFQDDVLRPALGAIPGVAEVASVGRRSARGAHRRQAARAARAGLAFTDVIAALGAGCSPPATAWPDASLAELEALPVRNAPPDRPPVRVGDVALVRLTEDMQTGLADLGGVRAVGGIVIARRDADIAALVEAVKRTIARECRKLPHRAADPARLDSGVAADVHVVTTYDRSELATRVRHTLLRALGEEVGVVVLVILIFLLSIRARAGPARDPAGRPAPDLRRDVDPGRAGHDHEPGRHRDRARHGRRRGHRGAGGLPPPSRDGRPAASADDRRAKLLARRPGVRAGDPHLAAHHGALVPAGVRVLRRDRATPAAARAHQDAGGARGRAGDADAGARAARSPAARAGHPGVRQPAHPRRWSGSTARSSTSRSGGRRSRWRRPGWRSSLRCRSQPASAASSCRASTRATCSTCRPRSPACRPSRRRSSSSGRTTP